MKRLKLEIDLVPRDAWARNLRKRIPRSVWNKIREDVIAKAARKCETCGSTSNLQCHEIWRYDDKKHVQKLTGFRSSCSMCHHVEHYGMSRVLARQGSLSLKAVDEHFLRVNQVPRRTLEQHLKVADALFLKRSRVSWRIDFGRWKALVLEHESALEESHKKDTTDLSSSIIAVMAKGGGCLMMTRAGKVFQCQIVAARLPMRASSVGMLTILRGGIEEKISTSDIDGVA